jgi:hypothetical protein
MKAKRATAVKPTTKRPGGRRALRARPVPRWLTGHRDLDEMAQRRCLLVLSVLSGEKPVTSAISELGISRPLYYQLETKALLAMLTALAPGANAMTSPDQATTTQRMAELEDKVQRLEQDKRRLERLLFLTRKVVPPGPITIPGRGRKPKLLSSTNGGPEPSSTSTRSAAMTTDPSTSSPSTPTPDGATTR